MYVNVMSGEDTGIPSPFIRTKLGGPRPRGGELRRLRINFANTLGSKIASAIGSSASAVDPKGDPSASSSVDGSESPPVFSILGCEQHPILDRVITAVIGCPTHDDAHRLVAAMSAVEIKGVSFTSNGNVPRHHSASTLLSNAGAGPAAASRRLHTSVINVEYLYLLSDEDRGAFKKVLNSVSPHESGDMHNWDHSLTRNINVSPIDFAAALTQAFPDRVDSSGEFIEMRLPPSGAAEFRRVSIAVIQTSSKHECAVCCSQCHRVVDCARKKMLRAKSQAAKDAKLRSDNEHAARIARDKATAMAFALEARMCAVFHATIQSCGSSAVTTEQRELTKRAVEAIRYVTDAAVLTCALLQVAPSANKGVIERATAHLSELISKLAALRAAEPAAAGASTSNHVVSTAASAAAPAQAAALSPRAAPAERQSACKPGCDAPSAICAMEVVDGAPGSDPTAAADPATTKRPLEVPPTPTGASPAAKRHHCADEALALVPAPRSFAPSPLPMPDRGLLLSVYGSGGILGMLELHARNGFPPEPVPHPRVFSVDLLGADAPISHIGNAIFRDLAQTMIEAEARGFGLEGLITALPDVDLERVAYTALSSHRIDGFSNTGSSGISIHQFNSSAGIFATEEGALYDNTGLFRIDIELSRSAAASNVESFKISRSNPALAKIAALLTLTAPDESLWRFARVLRVARGANVPLSPDRPALVAGVSASLASVPSQGVTALLRDGAGGGVGQDGK
jgi:hypothetical protein